MANEIVQVDVFDKLGKEKFEGTATSVPRCATRDSRSSRTTSRSVSVVAKAMKHAAKKMAGFALDTVKSRAEKVYVVTRTGRTRCHDERERILVSSILFEE